MKQKGKPISMGRTILLITNFEVIDGSKAFPETIESQMHQATKYIKP